MNRIHLTRQSEYGYNVPKDYDLALNYLKCYANDNFYSSVPSEEPMMVCRFCKVNNFEHYLALANENGLITIQDTNHNPSSSSVITQYRAHRNVIFDLAWSPEGQQLVSASGDHTAVLWDVQAGTETSMKAVHRFQGHVLSVKTISFKPEDKHVFATGSRDGRIIVWDTRSAQPNVITIQPDNIISSCHNRPETKVKGKPTLSEVLSITGLVFQDSQSLISCASGDRNIKVWDMRKCYTGYKYCPQPRHELLQPENMIKKGFSNLVLEPAGVRLYANCRDDTIYCYNVAGYDKQPVAMYRGHQNTSFFVKSCLSPDGKYLVSGSSDDKAYIWNVAKPGKPIVQLVGHRAEVSCVDWCSKGDIKLVTCSDDAHYNIWTMDLNSETTDVSRNLTGDLMGWTEPCSFVDTMKDYVVLFINTTPRTLKQTVIKQKRTPDVNSASVGNSSKRMKMDNQSTVVSPYPVNSVLRSDNKGARRLFDVDSTLGNTNSGIETLSPTANLPNYVIDGTSPHHRCPAKPQKENQNWLAKLQQTTPLPKSPFNDNSLWYRNSNEPNEVMVKLWKYFKKAVKKNQTQPCENEKESSQTEAMATMPSTS